MENQALISYNELMLVLRDLCVSRQTGTLLIITDDNHFAHLVLKNGNTVACKSGLKEGREAIQWMKTIKAGRYVFNKFVTDAAGSSVPLQINADELLKELTGKGIQTVSAAQQELQVRNFNAIRETIEEELTNVIGPIANIICEDCVDEMRGHDAREVLKLLKKITMEIETKKRAQFKKQLIAQLERFHIKQILIDYAASPD